MMTHFRFTQDSIIGPRQQSRLAPSFVLIDRLYNTKYRVTTRDTVAKLSCQPAVFEFLPSRSVTISDMSSQSSTPTQHADECQLRSTSSSSCLTLPCQRGPFTLLKNFYFCIPLIYPCSAIYGHL